MPRLADLANQRMLDEYAQASSYGNPRPDNQLASLIDRGVNFIRNDQTGRVIDLGQSQPEPPRFPGSPVDVFGQGRGYLDPSTGYIQGVNKQGQQFRVQPEGTQAAMQQRMKAVKAPEQRGQIVFDKEGNAFNINPYNNDVKPVIFGGSQIKGAQYSSELQGQIAGTKAARSETGKALGEAQVKLEDVRSMMPHLENLVTDLSNLGKKATYTQAGVMADATRRQAGLPVGEGAIARKEYISKVDNEILPLLRQTFGAAFTVKEGESLRATLGDPDASPEEKDAVLRSFIQTKASQIESMERRTGVAEQPQRQSGAPRVGQVVDGYVYTGGNPADPSSWKEQ